MFNSIKVIIWDFDGTLYPPNTELFRAVREAELRVIADHTGWTHEKSAEEFYALHKKSIASATAVTAQLSGISIPQAAIEMEQYFDRRNYVARDEKLIALFKALKEYRHIVLANGIESRHKQTLAVLGLPAETFELYVTSETVGTTKPDPAGFRFILTYTGLAPHEHLMIGDREDVDLVPAKALGMKTCLVYSDTTNSIADVMLSTVYEVSRVLYIKKY